MEQIIQNIINLKIQRKYNHIDKHFHLFFKDYVQSFIEITIDIRNITYYNISVKEDA